MSIFERIRRRIEDRQTRKRNKDLCSSCRWYYPESGVCQIKKCSGRSEYDQYVTKRNRRRCDNFDRKPIGKVVKIEETGGGLRFEIRTNGPVREALEEAYGKRLAEGMSAEGPDHLGIGYESDNALAETFTPNEHREWRGMSPVMKGPLPPPVKAEPGTVEYWDGETTHKFYINEYPQDKRPRTIRKRCAYCGTVSDRDYGTCEHCGAPL